MVVIPTGKFIMGSSTAEKAWAASRAGSPDGVADEAPQHEVIVQSCASGKYDVTRAEYAAFVRGNVWQWTEECYDNTCSPVSTDGRANEKPLIDIHALDSLGNCLQADRGSWFAFPAWALRSVTRERNPSGYRDTVMGFRLARTL